MAWIQAFEATAAAIIPTFAFAMNWRMRSKHGYALSAAADAALAIAAFDLAALVAHHVFSEVVRNSLFKQSFIILVVILFCVVVTAWMTLFLELEHAVTRSYDFRQRRYPSGRPIGPFLLGWSLLGSLLAIHILLFAYE